MVDAVTILISDLQQEKRAPDNKAEPIIVPNRDMQLAFEEIETFMNTPPIGGVSSFNTRTGAVVLQAGDVSGVGGIIAPLTAAQITAGGGMLTASPSFFAYCTTNPTNVTGAGQEYTPICNTVDFNTGAGYSNSSGIFTAPQSGKYYLYFKATVGPMASNHTAGIASLVLNTGRIYWGESLNPYAAQSGTILPTNGGCGLAVSATMNLIAGQNVTPQVAVNGTGSPTTVGIVGNTENAGTSFFGYLIPG